MKDPLKAWIASEMQSAVQQFQYRGIPEHEPGAVEVHVVSSLVTRVRVKTDNGIRYFDVTVKESY